MEVLFANLFLNCQNHVTVDKVLEGVYRYCEECVLFRVR